MPDCEATGASVVFVDKHYEHHPQIWQREAQEVSVEPALATTGKMTYYGVHCQTT
jgi:hypothetical protein